MKSRLTTILLILLALSQPVSAAADSRDEGSLVRQLRYDWKLDLAVTSVATAGWIITEVGMDHMAPAGCRWCQVNSFDDWGHRNIKWSNRGAAGKASHVTAYILAPMAAFGLDALAASKDGALSGFAVDALIIAEAVAISNFTTQLVKMAVGRQRPYAHYGAGSQNPSDNTSFYSGHSSLAFSLAVASGTVASMRGYSMAPWIWGAGLAIAGTTGYLRLAADKHYLTDVIAGAALGSAFGFGIPYLFHRPKSPLKKLPMVSAAPARGGALISVSGNW